MKNKIKKFKIKKLKNAKFIITGLAKYKQNGKDKSWEVIKAHDSVAILIYHTSRDTFVLVKQFRPAVYINNNDGLSLELCAGLVDKSLSLVDIAKEEIEEECGYSVKRENIKKITSFHTSVGFAGTMQTLYYAEVDDSMKVSEGGGVEDEQIEVVYLPTSKAKKVIYDENEVRTAGLMFAFLWWFGGRGIS
ncbi:MAG: NUDIX domain-containing protein [Sulfurovum sp.]